MYYKSCSGPYPKSLSIIDLLETRGVGMVKVIQSRIAASPATCGLGVREPQRGIGGRVRKRRGSGEAMARGQGSDAEGRRANWRLH